MEITAFDETQTLKAPATLAQQQRLRTFRALVVADPDGMTPATMAEQLAVDPSALSFHLKELVHAGLVTSEPRGRHLIYRASFAQMNALLAYLTQHCCEGGRCKVPPADATCRDC